MVVQAIQCRRCGGMMIKTYSDLLSPSEKGEDEFGWRCVNCGDYIDRQILANRTSKLSGSRRCRQKYALVNGEREGGRF
jgi:hypothetical protein